MTQEPGNREEDDRMLRAAFHALRREARSGGAVPDFQAMMAEARARLDPDAAEGSPSEARAERPRAGRSAGRGSRWLRWTPLAAAAAVAALLLVGRPGAAPDAEAEFERRVSDYRSLTGAGAWRSPTASLLTLPGVDLGAVPTFGRGPAGGRLPLNDPRRGRTP